MRAVHVDSQGEILNLELITIEKERAIKAEARVEELEAKLKEINDISTLALIEFGDYCVCRKINGDNRFENFKDVDKKMMELEK